ncbi:flagellin [Massilia norwichensis]|uniref:Flagellin n=2 Tax=Massilia norwichensis TaxID=1442366 RepID=A0ABT2A5W2_9BURK|nr:flagellin [Massilia norwichensis]
MDELVANINAQVGGITAALDDKGVLTLSNDTGAAITIKAKDADVARAAGLDSATAALDKDDKLVGATYNGYISLAGQNGAEIKLGGEDLAKLGFNASTGSGKLSGSAAIVDQATDADTAIGALNTASGKIASTDKVKINGVELNQDAFNDALTAGEKAQAINSLTAQTGVKATATTEAFVDLSNVGDGDKYAINGKTYTLHTDDAPGANAKTAEQKLVDQIQTAFAVGTSGGVNAEIDAKSGKARLFSSTGQDIVIGGDPAPLAAIDAGADPATITANAGTISISTAADSAGKVLNTATPDATDPAANPAAPNAGAIAIRGKISLTSESGGPIKLEDGTDGAGLAKLGLVEQGGSADPILGGKLDVSTAKGAQDAIGRIDKAIAYVAEQRSNMGAVQNRLSSTISNLATATENASSARSRIQDADFATETANMTRGQILQQAGTAMLAQANSLPNGVLSLLRG